MCMRQQIYVDCICMLAFLDAKGSWIQFQNVCVYAGIPTPTSNFLKTSRVSKNSAQFRQYLPRQRIRFYS